MACVFLELFLDLLRDRKPSLAACVCGRRPRKTGEIRDSPTLVLSCVSNGMKSASPVEANAQRAQWSWPPSEQTLCSVSLAGNYLLSDAL